MGGQSHWRIAVDDFYRCAAAGGRKLQRLLQLRGAPRASPRCAGRDYTADRFARTLPRRERRNGNDLRRAWTAGEKRLLIRQSLVRRLGRARRIGRRNSARDRLEGRRGGCRQRIVIWGRTGGSEMQAPHAADAAPLFEIVCRPAIPALNLGHREVD